MATVWSGYTTTGTYTKTRVRVDYSGTSATAILCYTRTNDYRAEPTGGTGTFSFGGKSVNYEKWFYGKQTDAEVARVSFSISTAGGQYSGSSSGAATYLKFSGSVTIPSQVSKPSGVTASASNIKWDRADITVKIGNWGGAASSIFAGMGNSNATAYYPGNRREVSVNVGTGTTSWTGTVTASSSCGGDGGVQVCKTIRGCLAFKALGLGRNSAGDGHGVSSSVYYTPPSPMTALSVTSQVGSTSSNSVTINYSTTGGNSTNNENVNVQAQYRYTTNNGSTWSAWTNVGSAATPWTARTGSFTVPYSTATKLQTRQVYQSQTSEVKEISFTSNAAVSPTTTCRISRIEKTSAMFEAYTTALGSNSSVTQYIEYRKSGDTNWTRSSASSGQYGKITISGLTPGQAYEFRSVSVGNNSMGLTGYSDVKKFTASAEIGKVLKDGKKRKVTRTIEVPALTAGSTTAHIPIPAAINDASAFRIWFDSESLSQGTGTSNDTAILNSASCTDFVTGTIAWNGAGFILERTIRASANWTNDEKFVSNTICWTNFNTNGRSSFKFDSVSGKPQIMCFTGDYVNGSAMQASLNAPYVGGGWQFSVDETNPPKVGGFATNKSTNGSITVTSQILRLKLEPKQAKIRIYRIDIYPRWNAENVPVVSLVPVEAGDTTYSENPAPENCMVDTITGQYYQPIQGDVEYITVKRELVATDALLENGKRRRLS